MSPTVNLQSRRWTRVLAACGRRMRDAWCIVGLAAAVFLALDRLAARVWDDSGVEALVQSRQFRQASPDLSDAMARELASEIHATHDSPFVATRFRWEPLVYWRSRAHAGRWINVDNSGLRRTIVPAKAEGKPAVSAGTSETVFCFGGSTMWGACVSDEATIPSLLAAELHKRGISAKLTNFAQMGYVSTQCRVALEQELQRGNVPTVALFYDGYNDIGSALANPTPGQAGDEYQRPSREQLIREPTLWSLGRHYLRASFTARVFQPDWREQLAAQIQRNLSETEANQVASAAVERYLNNIRLIQALAEAYGFEARFYWQPLLYARREPSDVEREILVAEPGAESMHRAARQVLVSAQRQWAKTDPAVRLLRDLSQVFDTANWRGKTAFFDACHLGEAGNRTVATALADDIQTALRERPASNRLHQRRPRLTEK